MSELQQTKQQLQQAISESRELALENYRLRKSGERSNSVNTELMNMISDFFNLDSDSKATINDIRQLFEKAKEERSGSVDAVSEQN